MENEKPEDKIPEISAEKVLEEISEEPKKETGTRERKQLKNVLLGIGIFIILIIALFFFISSIKNFEYKGTKWDIVREGNLLLYNTKVALINENGENYMNYNFYLRNDPRKSDIEFNGGLEIKKLAVLNSEGDFACNGDGIIAVANLKQLYEIIGTEVIRDENATCDSEGRYMYLNFKEGDKTKIEQAGNGCYDILINNCEILEGTERFMVETFEKING